jgi:general secretion pathway protein M
MTLAATITGWCGARAPRERIMLAAMLLAVLAFVLWLGAWRPLQAAADAAREHRMRATAALAEVRAGVAAIADLQARQPAPLTTDALANAVLRTAAAERVPISRQRTDEAGVFTVGIDAVQATILFGWLDTLKRQHGLAPIRLEVEERNGQLVAEAHFQPFRQALDDGS